ncbi:MAG TPA: hypothetical protein VMC81_00440 [Rhodocyclaceae bacterium]|nr:hypothetical protein [Rhodocyclaceae bacterium]
MRTALAVMVGCALCACSTTTKDIPSNRYLLPNATLKVSPSISVGLDKVVIWGALAGAAYYVLDPLAPNWDIEEAPMGEKHIHFSLRMKRYYAGGAGEAQEIFRRRARELARLNGYDGYDVLEYRESLDSSVIGSQRTAEGVIMLTRKSG